mmetsp:Transcript_13054/g.15845  ORF Transcript_13054/g.15845 Transcript_13054/m.15845 type:complete len:209 (-) Transcript_13054:42-668(-)
MEALGTGVGSGVGMLLSDFVGVFVGGETFSVLDTDCSSTAGVSSTKDSAAIFANATRSDSSSTRTPIGVPILIGEPPASTNIFARKPSSGSSKSTVALSVSISQSDSPADISSPSFLFQSAMTPSSIVGDRAGIVSMVWGGRELRHRRNIPGNESFEKPTTFLFDAANAPYRAKERNILSLFKLTDSLVTDNTENGHKLTRRQCSLQI